MSIRSYFIPVKSSTNEILNLEKVVPPSTVREASTIHNNVIHEASRIHNNVIHEVSMIHNKHENHDKKLSSLNILN